MEQPAQPTERSSESHYQWHMQNIMLHQYGQGVSITGERVGMHTEALHAVIQPLLTGPYIPPPPQVDTVRLVCDQTYCIPDEAQNALDACDGDVVDAIMLLTHESVFFCHRTIEPGLSNYIMESVRVATACYCYYLVQPEECVVCAKCSKYHSAPRYITFICSAAERTVMVPLFSPGTAM